MRAPGWTTLCLVAMYLASLGCAGPARAPMEREDRPLDLVWPDPPDRARLRFLMEFKDHHALGLRQSFRARLRDTLAGAELAGLIRPYAIAVDAQAIFVADPGLSAVHAFDLHRDLYLVTNQSGGTAFNSPVGLALAEDRVFIADSMRGTVYILNRELIEIGRIEDLNRPTSLTWDAESKRLFVADTHAHRIHVYDREGQYLASYGQRGERPGEFNFPTHLAIMEGRLYVNDTMNFRVQVLDGQGNPLIGFGRLGDSAGYSLLNCSFK